MPDYKLSKTVNSGRRTVKWSKFASSFSNYEIYDVTFGKTQKSTHIWIFFFAIPPNIVTLQQIISRLSLTFVSPDSLKIIGKSSIFKISYPGYLIIIRLSRFKKYKNPNKKLFYQRFFINTRDAKDLGSFRWYFIEEVVSSCTMFLKSVDYVHDGLDVFRCFMRFLDVY